MLRAGWLGSPHLGGPLQSVQGPTSPSPLRAIPLLLRPFQQELRVNLECGVRGAPQCGWSLPGRVLRSPMGASTTSQAVQARPLAWVHVSSARCLCRSGGGGRPPEGDGEVWRGCALCGQRVPLSWAALLGCARRSGKPPVSPRPHIGIRDAQAWDTGMVKYRGPERREGESLCRVREGECRQGEGRGSWGGGGLTPK